MNELFFLPKDDGTEIESKHTQILYSSSHDPLPSLQMAFFVQAILVPLFPATVIVALSAANEN